MNEAEIRDRCDIRRSTQIRPTEQIHVLISQQVINNVKPTSKPYLKDQLIKRKYKIGDEVSSGLQCKYMSF